MPYFKAPACKRMFVFLLTLFITASICAFAAVVLGDWFEPFSVMQEKEESPNTYPTKSQGQMPKTQQPN